MRGYQTDTYTGETPLADDATFPEKAFNRRVTLAQSAIGERVPYLETDFQRGIAQTVRRLTADQAARLVVEGVAYPCQECARIDGRATLHITVGRTLDSVEAVVGSGENIARSAANTR